MRHDHRSRFLCAILLCATSLANAANAQEKTPACTVSRGALLDMVLEDGTYGTVFPVEMVSRPDSVLVLGPGGPTNARGRRIHLTGEDSSTAGFLLTNQRRTVTRIPTPPGLPTARYFRARASESGWEAVFFVPDRDTVPGGRMFDDGTFWYGRLLGGRWRDVERVGRVQAANVLRPNSSGLIMSDGELRFAVFFGDQSSPGGVLLWHRTDSGRWRVDTLPARQGPLSVTAAPDGEELGDARLLAVVANWEAGDFDAGSLVAMDASTPAASHVVRTSALESMNEPMEYMIGGVLHTSWWEFGRGEPPALWYQALDPRKKNTREGTRRVASNVNEFTFFAVPEGTQRRLVWAYRSNSTPDSAEVAVVANGEPEVIGRVAFPFGFMTNGVASGDRSFILATTPRPIPGGGPSASRTLELRVNCRGGT